MTGGRAGDHGDAGRQRRQTARFLPAAALALALAAAAAPAASSTPIRLPPAPGSAVPVMPLADLLIEEDYPAAAARAGQLGTVYFRLSIGLDGRVHGCAVTKSSGSALLDSATCGLMVRRTRFTPATDPQGAPRSDEYDGQIEWRLPGAGRRGGRVGKVRASARQRAEIPRREQG
jgi:TonB family protein